MGSSDPRLRGERGKGVAIENNFEIQFGKYAVLPFPFTRIAK